MLRVTTIHANTAGPSARYYTHYLAADGAESEGQWLGHQAAGLRLTGSVSTGDLEAILSGHDPVTGTRLGNPLVDRWDARGNLIPAVAGFDATFSAPKSLSVWWGLTGDPGLLDAHDIAVRAVLDHLECHGANTRVRVNGSRQHPEVDGLVMAAFRQATSREDDPQIHTHVVISTKVQSPDGRWLALDARYLKRKQRALGGLYQSVLRAELTHRYGVAWQPIVLGQAEIEGMPDELLDVFSKRTAQVKAALDSKVSDFRDREGRDPTRWERAALTRQAAEDSRSNKSHASATKLDVDWSEEAAALGWTPDRMTRALQAAADGVRPTDTLDLAAVLEKLSTSGSTWTRADVLQAICDLTPPVTHLSGRDWAKAVEDVADRAIATCVDLDPSDHGAPTRASDGRSVWLAPTEPHLTHERVLAEEERIVTFAIEAQDDPAQPSSTLGRNGLDALQADAAAAVSGHDTLVLVVGPAGTGKTTTLRRAVEDLRQHDRDVFGVAPTAKAAKVLRDETRMAAETVAKLLYEWRDGQPKDEFRLPKDTTLVVDEAGMLGTGALDRLVRLTVSQQWRLVLVGDPRQLQAVGRGGMFDELCRSGRVHELATIHRFHHRWEQRASLRLRSGYSDALDEYFHHRRVTPGTFDRLTDAIAERWIDETAIGRAVAVVAETNEHVDALNAAIQQVRRHDGHLGGPGVRLAEGETAAVGDIVVTRRNERALRTDRGEPARNRDRWTVTAIHSDGSLTVSHLGRHGTTTLPSDYARQHVRLGYAATAHGHQGDTVDVSLAVVTEATSHRSLYVATTRGRDENQLYVATDEPDRARDILERILTNDRADLPAVAQRRSLARQVPRARDAEDAVAKAQGALDEALRAAEPALQPLRAAEAELSAAERQLREHRRVLDEAPWWRRREIASLVRGGCDAVQAARAKVGEYERAAAPHSARIDSAQNDLREAEHRTSVARLWDRLDRLQVEPPARTIECGVGIEPPGLGL